MIFLTVGTQLPFARLVAAVDRWAGACGRGAEIFGQIADPGPGGYRPRRFEWAAHLDPAAFRARFAAADAIVAHAGMGTIIAALSEAKPLLIMPRRAHLGEQRNDHQMATARRFGAKPGVFAAIEAEEAADKLDALAAASAEGRDPIAPFAEDRLIAAVRAAIRGEAAAPGRMD